MIVMKSSVYVYCVLLIILMSCSTRDIEVFHGPHEIYFEKFYMNALAPGTENADSTLVSFFFYPENTKELSVPLVVLLSGSNFTSDLSFGIRVVEEGTTAHGNEYEVSEVYTFHSRPITDGITDFRDTIEIKLKYSDRLSSMGNAGLRLVLELVPNEQVSLGQFERRRAIVVWSNVAAKPDWWDLEVEYVLFGAYTYEKYKLFLEVVEDSHTLNGDLIQNNPAKVRAMVEYFKKWLVEHTDDPEKGDDYKEILESLV